MHGVTCMIKNPLINDKLFVKTVNNKEPDDSGNVSITANDIDMQYNVGDTLTINRLVINGYVTSSATRIYTQIPIPAKINASSFSITGGDCQIRQTGNYIYGTATENADITALTLATAWITPIGLFINWDSDNYNNPTNNCVCSLYIRNLTIVFE